MSKTVTLIGSILVCSMVLCSGCIEEQNQYTSVKKLDDPVDMSKFVGTWAGNMEFSMFNWDDNTSSSIITELEFTEGTLYMTITTNNITQTMPNAYTIEGDQLLLSPIFTGDIPFDRSQFNGSERPPFGFNQSEPPPFNGERPLDGERPFDGESPFDGQRPSRTRSYSYSFSENNRILYLNDSPFSKEI